MHVVGSSKFVLIAESQNTKTGLGVRFGTWLLERGLSPRFARCGTHREGCGGQWQQAYHQGYDSVSVMRKVRKMIGDRSKTVNKKLGLSVSKTADSLGCFDSLDSL